MDSHFINSESAEGFSQIFWLRNCQIYSSLQLQAWTSRLSTMFELQVSFILKPLVKSYGISPAHILHNLNPVSSKEQQQNPFNHFNRFKEWFSETVVACRWKI